MSKVPIFVSCATNLNDDQEKRRTIIIKLLDELNMEARALGRSDYPKDYPLKEIYVLAKHCAGVLYLGLNRHILREVRQKEVLMMKRLLKNLYLFQHHGII